MAELKSTTYTAQETAGEKSASMIATAELISGKVQFLQCEWLVPAGNAANDTVLLGYLPSGVTIIPGHSSILISGAGGATTINLGVGDDVSALADGVDVSAAGSFLISGTAGTAVSHKTTERTALVAELQGTITTGITIVFNMFVVNSN